jgi:hypothetical protein
MEFINNFTYQEFILLQYSKPVVINENQDNISEYCEYMMRLSLINREKRFRALNKRTCIQYQNGMLSHKDSMNEHLRTYSKFSTDEDQFEEFKYNIFYHHYNNLQDAIKKQKVIALAMQPRLIKKFNKDFKVISVLTYDYPAHWNARGYKNDRETLRDAKKKIVRFYRKKMAH